MKPLLFGGGGLADVARRFYVTNTYEALALLQEPTLILCWCHNPAALEYFRFHPNHENVVLVDLAHIYMDFIRGPKMDGGEVKRRLLSMCGLEEKLQITKKREPNPIGHFHGADVIASKGRIVIHPFGRGWGDWPEEACDALRAAPPETRVYVISADYVASDGRVKKESFPCELPNVTVLKNLSAPAAFTLVATAARFIGSMSVLAQVAAFEQVPSIVLHPAKCSDFKPPYSNYSRTIWNANGIALAYDGISRETIENTLIRFVARPDTALLMREAFRDVDPRFAEDGNAK